MLLTLPDHYKAFFEAALDQWAPGSKYAVIRLLDGGRTSASVYVVDIAPSKTGKQPLSGQYILKLQVRADIWDTGTESNRHAISFERNPLFASRHIPVLVKHVENAEYIGLLYEIAGYSLATVVTADCVEAGVLEHYGCQVSNKLLTEWNSEYEIQLNVSANSTLRLWLGYRLDPTQAPGLHEFVDKELGNGSTTVLAGRLLVNPLWLCTCNAAMNNSGVRFSGLIHGDLHPGNIMVDRQSVQADSFWLIDFALSGPAPLFYDHAYLELALLLNHLDGLTKERLIGVLEALEAPPTSERSAMVPVADSGLVACLRSIRSTADQWQASHERLRRDPYVAQQLLARVAAALNWVNKPITAANRVLSLAYGCWAATTYLKPFEPQVWASILYEAENRTHQLGSQDRATEEGTFTLPPFWPEFWEDCARFDEAEAAFVLITGSLDKTVDLAPLGCLPWSAVVDLDPVSDEAGLYSAASLTVTKLRSIHVYGRNPLPLAADRSTSWLMAGGWPSHLEQIPRSLTEWRRVYLRCIRELLASLRHAVAPRPVKVLALPGPNLETDRLNRILEVVDEELQDAGQVLLLTEEEATLSISVGHYPFTATAFASSISAVYGSQSESSEPEIPAATGSVRIPLDRLRNWEEDLDVLHARILIDTARTGSTDEFWRGHPPTWTDLHAGADIQRSIHSKLLETLESLLAQSKSHTLELHHLPGAGGTTAAFRAVFSLRHSYPTAVLHRFSKLTVDRVDQVFQLTQKPVLLLAEAADLSPTDREELYRGLATRNSRVVILYVVRTTSVDKDRELALAYPMHEQEADQFVREFSARTTDIGKQWQLSRLARSTDPRYICPFFFGLTLYAQDFTSIDRYVSVYLQGASYRVQKLLRYVALVTRFSQVGLEEALLRRMIGLQPTSRITADEMLGVKAAGLILKVGRQLRILHAIVAEEMLKQLLGGTDNWKDGLKDLAVDFIRECVSLLGPDSQYLTKLFTHLFTRRDEWLMLGLRSNFSELIRTIPNKAGQHQVFQLLTDLCPNQPHYWNHLGRHHIYEMQHDFGTAEAYLKRAVELAPRDSFHHHSLGMVLRFWVRDIFKDILRSPEAIAPVDMLRRVRELAARAAECFGQARDLQPEDDHGYITHIQMILETSERLMRASGGNSLQDLKENKDEVADWIRANVVVAEDLLSRVAHSRAEGKPSTLEVRCGTRLTRLFGDFIAAIQTWEDMLKRSDTDHGTLRRAVATAYYCKARRLWSGLSQQELVRVSDLLEENLHEDPTNDRDVRVWFQTYKRLPDFSYLQALDRLEAWAARSDSIEAHYYSYVLHFLLWHSGISRSETQIMTHLDRCKELAVGRRGHSYEWLATEPGWCPLVNYSELGGFNRRKGFYNDVSKLAFVHGVIEDMKGPQAGVIRIGNATRAFFVPGTEFWASQDINAVVHFYLGFAYGGLRAWKQVLGRAPAWDDSSSRTVVEKDVTGVPEIAGPRKQPISADEIEKGRQAGELARRRQVADVIRDLLKTAEHQGCPLYLAALGIKLLEHFPEMEIGRKRGHISLKRFRQQFDEFAIAGSGTTATVVWREKAAVQQDHEGRDLSIARHAAVGVGELREQVASVVRAFASTMAREGRLLYASRLGLQLRREFPGIPVYKRLGYDRLTEFLSTLEGITLGGTRNKTTVRLESGR